jgi:hypothetical protein
MIIYMPTFTYMVMAVSLDPNTTNLTNRKSVLTSKLSYILSVVKLRHKDY